MKSRINVFVWDKGTGSNPMLAGLFSPVPYEYKNSYYASDIAINKIMENDRKC